VDLAGIKHSFTIHGPAAWDQLTGPRRLPTHDVFCYGTLIGRSEHALGTLQRLLSQTDAFRALDVNLRPPQSVDDALRIGAAEATLIKMSVDELHGAAENLGLRSEPRAFFDHAPRLRWVCITRGPDGAELHDRAGGRWLASGQKVAVVDTVGAGDAFFAGLIDGLAHKRGAQAALETAQARAVATVTQRGGLPPIE
jgi:fructokinase